MNTPQSRTNISVHEYLQCSALPNRCTMCASGTHRPPLTVPTCCWVQVDAAFIFTACGKTISWSAFTFLRVPVLMVCSIASTLIQYVHWHCQVCECEFYQLHVWYRCVEMFIYPAVHKELLQCIHSFKMSLGDLGITFQNTTPDS